MQPRADAPLKAIAIANNACSVIFWSWQCKIPNCLGMAVRRRYRATGKIVVLPAWIGFEDNPDWEPKTTEDWPIQSMRWKDTTLTEQEVEVDYQVVPMVGTAGALTPREDLAVWTNPVKLSKECGQYINAGFTRSVISSQGILKDLGMRGKSPDLDKVRQVISTPGPVRDLLSNDIIDMVLAPLDWAVKHNGKSYEARYELSDQETIERYIAAKAYLELILGNTGPDDDTNKAGRAQLKAAGVDVIDRMLAKEFTPHNKCAVGVGSNGVPGIVGGGKTNATPTGYCCQWQNAITILSQALGQQYLDEWNLLKADDSQSGDALRAANAVQKPLVTLPDGTNVQVFFDPDMKERVKPKVNPAEPPDFAFIRPLLKNAKELHFLFFEPGSPSFLNDIAALSKDPAVFLRGAVNGPDSIPQGVKIYKRPGAPPVVVRASFIERQVGSWMPEIGLLPGAHALIHSFVLVINPRDPQNCVVVTGSPNGGYHASYQNDENLLVITGNQLLAFRYLVHVDDAWSHYTMRAAISSAQKGQTGDARKSSNGFHLATTDAWQDPYMAPGPQHDEMFMWTDTKLPSFV